MKARIAEVFDSVQGEGLYLGEKQLFVRFFGCNLSCRFCDTRLNRFVEYEPGELFAEIKMYQDNYHSISYTGGEPLLHKDFLKQLLILTHRNGFRNYLETNGTLVGELEEVIYYLDIVAMDIKLPSSSGMGNLWGLHRKFLKVASIQEVFLKAIICQDTREEDLLEAFSLIKEINRAAVLVLQPNSSDPQEKLRPKLEALQDLCVKNEVTSCIIPQIHKMVGIK